MATLQDALSVPDGWSVVDHQQPVDISTVAPTTAVEIETVELWAVDVAGIEFGTPSLAGALQQAAAEHGSAVYGVALLKHDTPEQCGGFPTLGGLVTCTRYRYVIVHSQFQAIAVLLLFIVAAGLFVVWICNEQASSSPCSSQVQSFAHDTLGQMCQIFGAGCALQALGTVIIGASLLGIAFAGVLFFLETGVAQRLGIRGPALPAVRAPQAPQAPRVSVRAPTPIPITASTGGRGGGGRRGRGGGF